MRYSIGAIYLPLLPCFGLSASANASTIESGKVTAIYAYGNKGTLNVSGTRTTPAPPCAVSGQYAFDLTTPAGQAKYATALTAYTTQANVYIAGANACPDWGDRETIDAIGLIP